MARPRTPGNDPTIYKNAVVRVALESEQGFCFLYMIRQITVIKAGSGGGWFFDPVLAAPISDYESFREKHKKVLEILEKDRPTHSNIKK